MQTFDNFSGIALATIQLLKQTKGKIDEQIKEIFN